MPHIQDKYKSGLGWYVVTAFGRHLDKIIDMLSSDPNIYEIEKGKGGSYIYIKTQGEDTLGEDTLGKDTLKKILSQPFIWSLISKGNLVTDMIQPLSEEEVVRLGLEPIGYKVLEDSNNLDTIFSGKGDYNSTQKVLQLIEDNNYKLVQILDMSFNSDKQTKEFYYKSPVIETKKASFLFKNKEAAYSTQTGLNTIINDLNNIKFTLTSSYRESILPISELETYVNSQSDTNRHTLPINFKTNREEIITSQEFSIENGLLEKETLEALLAKANNIALQLLPQVQKDFSEGKYPELIKDKNIYKQNENLPKPPKPEEINKQENEFSGMDFLIDTYSTKISSKDSDILKKSTYKGLLKFAVEEKELENDKQNTNIEDTNLNTLITESNPSAKPSNPIFQDKEIKEGVYSEVGIVISFYGIYAVCKFFYGGKELKYLGDENIASHIVLSENKEAGTMSTFDDFYTIISYKGNEIFSQSFENILEEKLKAIPYIGEPTPFNSEPGFYEGTKQIKRAYGINTSLMKSVVEKTANLYRNYKI